MTGTELFPAPAWVQAVFVCLFIVLVIYLRVQEAQQNKDSRNFQKSESDSNREFQKQESDKWQKFIADMNVSFQKFNRDQREENNCAMADVNESLTNLTRTTGDLARSVEEMRSDLKDHDLQAKEILNFVQKPTVKLPPKPRAKVEPR